METELIPQYDSRKSFYRKTTVINEGNTRQLRSYSTIVAEIKNDTPIIFGTYSDTTFRHITEFLKQNGFKADTKKQIMADYFKNG